MTIANERRPAGRWKEPTAGYQAEINIGQITKALKEKRRGIAFFKHLTVEREVRICIRYLSDDEYRLTGIARDIKARSANVRQMFAAYGIDIVSRRLINANC